jgi:hypothetical protein
VREQTKYVIAVVAATVVGVAAITHQSLWIDEGEAAVKAMQPTLNDWWQTLRVEGSSNLQLLFQLFYLWEWEKIFGSSEYALRASNLPCFAAAAAAMVWGFPKQCRLQISVLLLTLTNAFLWYYLSEARPYVVLFAFSALTTACLLRLLRGPQSSLHSAAWFRFFCIAIAGLCTTSIIAVPWALASLGAFAYWSGPRLAFRTAIRFWFSSLVLTAVMGALGLYYVWTLRLGAPASNVWRTGLASVGLIFYEILGLSGLGPGRLAIRGNGIHSFAAFLPSLAIAAIAIAILSIAALAELSRKISRREVLFFAIAIATPFAAVLAAGYTSHMRLLGRHLIPFLPFVLAFLAIGLHRFFSSPARGPRVIAAAAILVFSISALEIRFAARHRRDDYRTAAAEARRALANGEKIWWVADISTGAYYRVPLNSPALLDSAALDRIGLETLEQPDLIILSKPDIYDSKGKISAYLSRHNFRLTRELPAFQLWRKPSIHAAPHLTLRPNARYAVEQPAVSNTWQRNP